MQKSVKKFITDRVVRALKPPASGRVEIWDEQLKGFGICVSHTGAASYVLYARIPPSRVPSRRSIGAVSRMSLADARAVARKWLELVEIGIDPREEEARRRSSAFANVSDDYIAKHLSKLRRGAKDAQEIRRVLIPAWGDRPITSITRAEIVALVGDIGARHSATAHLILGHTKRIFSWALDRDTYGLQFSPATDIKTKKVIMKACDTIGYPYGTFYKLVALTGARNTEARRAQWKEFDLSTAIWTVPEERYKSGQVHRVPLSSDAISLLRTLDRFEGSDWLFTYDGKIPINSGSQHKKELVAAMERIPKDSTPFTVHDIRRTVRTRLAALRVPSEIAEMIIGHGKRGMERVYNQHQYLDEMREALEAWARCLRSIVNPPPANVVKMKARAR
jgi:integrase